MGNYLLLLVDLLYNVGNCYYLVRSCGDIIFEKIIVWKKIEILSFFVLSIGFVKEKKFIIKDLLGVWIDDVSLV